MNLLFLCIKIFLARILDVSIGTIRTLIMVKGKIYITTILAFLEVFIWFIVAKEALVTKIDNILIPISYSLGYATGTFLGSYICNNLASALENTLLLLYYFIYPLHQGRMRFIGKARIHRKKRKTPQSA